MLTQIVLIGAVLLGMSTSQEAPKDMKVIEIKYKDGATSVVEDIAVNIKGNIEFHHLKMKGNEDRKRRGTESDNDSGEEETDQFVMRDYDRGLEVVIPPNSTFCLVKRLANSDQMVNRSMFDQATNTGDDEEPQAVDGVLSEIEECKNFTYRDNDEKLDESDLPKEIKDLCAEREFRFVEEMSEAPDAVSRRSTRMKRWSLCCYWRRVLHRVCVNYYYTERYCCQYRNSGLWWTRRRTCTRWCNRRTRYCYITWVWKVICIRCLG